MRGLIGPREAPRLWERHLLNCAVLGEVVPRGAAVADVGSGAGLPGLVLAIARPDLRVTLVEPLLRRTRFLEEAVDLLGLRATGRGACGRGPRSWPGRTFDVVTARAVAPLARLARWCLPLVAPGGELVAMKGSSAPAEVAEAGPELRRWAAPRRWWSSWAAGRSSTDLGGPGGPARERAGRLARSPRLRAWTGRFAHEQAHERAAEGRVNDGTGLGWPGVPDGDPRELSTGLGWPAERVRPQGEPVSPQADTSSATACGAAAEAPVSRETSALAASPRVRTAGDLSDLPPSFDDETTPLARAAENSVLARLGSRRPCRDAASRVTPAWWWWPTRRAASARPRRR